MRLVCAPKCFQIARYQDRVYLTLSLVRNCLVAARMNVDFVQVPWPLFRVRVPMFDPMFPMGPRSDENYKKLVLCYVDNNND